MNILVNNVSFNYDEANWSSDGLSDKKMQPIIALCSLSFNIVGSYGSQPGDLTPIPLADTVGGFYQRANPA